ncbi:NAD(P)-binding protein [Bimuria novae-zelandiae CBS 107.79]|uniref:NAD(P)-binding protein n=1 Tax=Bimuria novae-zelandiae CBS 107.79 TaxID=1447943 RepID=A0A6A5V6L2_9PLEO|nr:NAD(P)-binding protein [Bimuria novae-zelandiae CBS 107.79]
MDPVLSTQDSASITEDILASQKGKVFIATGGSSGIGFELSKMSYAAGAKVYILSRTQSNVESAIKQIEEAHKTTPKDRLCSLNFILLDLADLECESRLDVLYCNARLAAVPGGRKTQKGLRLHLGVNCVAHVLLETLLFSVLTATAKTSPKDSVRVVWAASILVELGSPIVSSSPSPIHKCV